MIYMKNTLCILLYLNYFKLMLFRDKYICQNALVESTPYSKKSTVNSRNESSEALSKAYAHGYSKNMLVVFMCFSGNILV